MQVLNAQIEGIQYMQEFGKVDKQAVTQAKRTKLHLLPATQHEHGNYAENLLTREEQAICDMATD